MRTALLIIACTLACGSSAAAQWNPVVGQWGKSEPTDLRVVTFNIEDGICTTAIKAEGYNQWSALARTIAILQPDILIVQEAGDNNGNGTGSGVDSPAALATAFGLFLRGGIDTFRGGVEVTAYVQQHAPGYDLPHVYISTNTDGFNRNFIASRYPFADLNGNGVATYSDFFIVAPTGSYWNAGTGGIRGFMAAEIDLPDAIYAGDVVVGNSHLKAGSTASDRTDRETAAQRIAAFIDAMYNGRGTPNPDPSGIVLIPNRPARLVSPQTPVIWGGDWNEDEATNGRKGPAEWMVCAAVCGGSDGTDRDRSDATYDDAREFFTNARTTRSNAKLDYIAWQDSIAGVRRAFVFKSENIPSGSIPPAMASFLVAPSVMSGLASDHRPVVVDFILPLREIGCPADFNGDGAVTSADITAFLSAWFDARAGASVPGADFNGDGQVTSADITAFLSAWFDARAGGC